MICYVGAALAIILSGLLGRYIKKNYCEYFKYSGFPLGFLAGYITLLSVYMYIFDLDFSNWHYITPLNVLVLYITIVVGYSSYMDVVNPKRSHTVDGVLLGLFLMIAYAIFCARLEYWFNLDLHFLFFPWHH